MALIILAITVLCGIYYYKKIYLKDNSGTTSLDNRKGTKVQIKRISFGKFDRSKKLNQSLRNNDAEYNRLKIESLKVL